MDTAATVLAAAFGKDLEEVTPDTAVGFRLVAEFMQDVHFHRREYLSRNGQSIE